MYMMMMIQPSVYTEKLFFVCQKILMIAFYLLGGTLQQQQTTTSSIGPDELPPPYTSSTEDRGMPMVTCRVCSAMIDISWKREQHVVKCNQCNEATV